MDIKEILSGIKHPNILLEFFLPNKRLKDFEKFDSIYPLSASHFVLFKMEINNGETIFESSSYYYFISKHVYITSLIDIDYIAESASHCTLLYEKSGIKSFELFFNTQFETHHLVLNLNDGNIFRSVGFKSDAKIPDNFIVALNKSLKISR